MENPQSGLGVTGPVAKFNWLYWSVTGFSLLGIGAVLVALMLPPVTRGREAPRRTQCKNNLKQIAVALWQYQEEWHALPPAITIDSYGRPLHSWRTLILPYLDQRPLYEKIDLSKPWDDPVNAELLSKAPWVYRCPSGSGPPNHTTYLACVVPNGSFRPIDPRVVSEIKDRFAETLLVIEVPPDRAVPQASPQDADEELIMSLGADLKTAHVGGVHAAMCDGSVRFLSSNVSPAVLKALISIAGADDPGEF